MKRVVLLLLMISILIITGCKKSTEPEDGSYEVIITHSGYDFSERKSGDEPNADYSKMDGETICWSPQPNDTPNIWGTKIWFRTSEYPAKMYKLGPVDFESVSSVDDSRWQDNFDDKPLVNGDVWVIKALDGYVKFQVLDAPVDESGVNAREMWWVKVKFKYSPNKNF